MTESYVASVRKYGSTVPFSFTVIGLPWRSTDFPATTRTQPSLTQYSSTLLRSTPLKRMPTPRSNSSRLKNGLLGSLQRRSGSVSVMGDLITDHCCQSNRIDRKHFCTSIQAQ